VNLAFGFDIAVARNSAGCPYGESRGIEALNRLFWHCEAIFNSGDCGF
jgi:hypothetical protein